MTKSIANTTTTTTKKATAKKATDRAIGQSVSVALTCEDTTDRLTQFRGSAITVKADNTLDTSTFRGSQAVTREIESGHDTIKQFEDYLLGITSDTTSARGLDAMRQTVEIIAAALAPRHACFSFNPMGQAVMSETAVKAYCAEKRRDEVKRINEILKGSSEEYAETLALFDNADKYKAHLKAIEVKALNRVVSEAARKQLHLQRQVLNSGVSSYTKSSLKGLSGSARDKRAKRQARRRQASK